jgi:diacylglycerol kinase
MRSFIIGRIKGFGFAIKGFLLLLRTEHSIITQSIIALIVTAMGFFFHINQTEWMIQILAIGFVLSIESLNTAVEKICDFIHPDFHEKIGIIKDISAGAVTFAALAAILVGVLIYYPYLMRM